MKTPLLLPGVILVLIAGACSSPSDPGTDVPVTTSVAADTLLQPVRLELSMTPSTFPAVAGVALGFRVLAFDANGERVNSFRSEVTVSDPAVAALSIIPATNSGQRPEAYGYLDLRRPGTFEVHARYGTATASMMVEALPDPPVSDDLIVESFHVVEYPVVCAWQCPYLAYAPSFRLRAADDAGPVTLRGVELSIAAHRNRLCQDQIPFAPGQSRLLEGADPYLWINPLVLTSLDGIPLPGDTASLRLIVQRSDGSFGTVRATGPVHRRTSNTTAPGLPTWEWGC